jgi:signal transduction histidine kinase
MGERTVPIDSLPDPVAGYAFADGRPVIAEVNDAFDAVYDAAVGTPVRRWLRTGVGADEAAAEDVCAALADRRPAATDPGEPSTADRLAVGSDARVYRLDAAAGADEIEGYALVSDRSRIGVEMDRIASVVSHDLRNPLDVAKAHLRAARETGERAHFDQIAASHDRMEQIIRDVLTLARGEDALEPVDDVEIAGVAADAWATVDTETASLAIADGLATVRADPDRLQRLFENLFRNSVEHASPGRTAPEAADDRLALRVGGTQDGFFVADDGVGIPPDERPRVFDPGYSSTDTGTGLGLTIVRQIAEAHDWSVRATTGPRGGARFEFRLPSRESSSGSGSENEGDNEHGDGSRP